MKKIRITPFPNLKITEEAYQRDVVGNIKKTSQKPKKKSVKNNKIKVMVNDFENGERRINFATPVTKTDRTFWAVFPDPILLYLSQAIHQFNVSEKLEKEKFIEESLKVIDNKVYMLNSNSDKTNNVYNLYLQYRIGAIIMLVCCLEAFVNSLIPDDFKFINEKETELNKFDVQRKLPLKKKIIDVLPLINSINIKDDYPVLLTRINQLNRMRNEFVHLKNYSSDPFSNDYHKLFKDMQKFDIQKHILAIKDYINLLKPDFIKDEK